MDIHSLKFGDIVHSSDDTLIKVHHIGKNGEVYYLAYADAARGRLQKEQYISFYGYISSCYQATEYEKKWLEDWITKKRDREEYYVKQVEN